MKTKLREIRMRDYLMTQTDFAKFLEIDIGQYNRYEKGNVSPTLELALKIANKLNKSVNEIFSLD